MALTTSRSNSSPSPTYTSSRTPNDLSRCTRTGGAADGIDQTGGDRLVGQLGGAPPRQRHPAGRGQLAGQGLDLGLLHRGEPGRAAAAFPVAQPVEGVAGEPAPPLARGVGGDPTPAGDRGVGVPGGGVQHDLGPQPVPVRALVTPGDLLQAVPLRGGQPHRVCAWGGHRPIHRCSAVRRSPIMDDPGTRCTQARRSGSMHPCPPRRSPPRSPWVSGCASAPANAGPLSPPSTCATAAGSPTSPASWPMAPPCRCAGCATAATPTGGALPSTWPAKTDTKTPSCQAATRSVPPKKPSTAPAACTSTTPPPGTPSNPRRTSAQDH